MRGGSLLLDECSLAGRPWASNLRGALRVDDASPTVPDRPRALPSLTDHARVPRSGRGPRGIAEGDVQLLGRDACKNCYGGARSAIVRVIRQASCLSRLQRTTEVRPPNLSGVGHSEGVATCNDVTADDIHTGAVTPAKLADGVVSTAKLADGAVISAKIAGLAVGSGSRRRYTNGKCATAAWRCRPLGACGRWRRRMRS